MEQGSVEFVCAGLSDDVDHPARRTSELSRSTGSDDLKLLHCIEGDVDRSPLAARLFSEETVVVVAAVQTDVVKDPALPCEVNLIAVRALNDTHIGRKRKKVLKFTAENRRAVYCSFIQRRTGFRFCRIYRRYSRDCDGFCNFRDFHRKPL
jgi:hypothetical protein